MSEINEMKLRNIKRSAAWNVFIMWFENKNWVPIADKHKLHMMGDYKFVYHNHFCVKNWYGKIVNLLSYSYQRITTRSCKINHIHCYQDVIHQNCHSSIYFCFLITRWNLNSYRTILWIWNVCIDSMVCITVEYISRQYGMCHCGMCIQTV